MYRLSRALLAVTVGMWGLSTFVLFLKLPPQVIGFIAICIVGLWLKRRTKPNTTLGSARWANARELRGMLDAATGLTIGKLSGARHSVSGGVMALMSKKVKPQEACHAFLRALSKKNEPMVRLADAVHTAVFAPTGVGKGVSCVIPFLLDSPDSCVVIDLKGELAEKTLRQREAMGHQCVLLDPFDVVSSKMGRKADTFNPLDSIKRGSRDALDDCRAFAEAQVISTGEERDPHWNQSAEGKIATITAAVVELGEEQRSPQTVRDLLSNREKMEAVIGLVKQSTAHDGMLARMGAQEDNYQGDELASVMTTTNRHLRYLDTPAVADSTKSSSFDTAKLRDGRMTVYLILPPEHMRTQSALLRLWITSLMRAVIKGGLQEQRLVHFVLDEAASLGHMNCIDDAIDKYRGFGIRLQFYFQSIGQLKKCFPDGQEQVLMSNTSQVFFGVNDLQTAEYVSNRIGDETILVDAGGTSGGSSNQHSGHGGPTYGHSSNHNSSWSQQARKLIKPDEVMALHPRIAVSFVSGQRPICTTLMRYYEKNERPLGWFMTFMAACFWFAVSFIAMVAVAAA